MPMTKNNDNPTSTLCENKKLLTIMLKLVTQANPARHLWCPKWHLRSPFMEATERDGQWTFKKTSPGNQGKITSHGMVNGHKNKPWKPGKDNFSWEDKKRSTGNQGNSYNLSWVASYNISVQWICFLMLIDKWVLNIIWYRPGFQGAEIGAGWLPRHPSARRHWPRFLSRLCHSFL